MAIARSITEEHETKGDDYVHMLHASTCLAPDSRRGERPTPPANSFGLFFPLVPSECSAFWTLCHTLAVWLHSPHPVLSALQSTHRMLLLCRSAQPALTKPRLKMVLLWEVFSVLLLVSQMETSMNCSLIDHCLSPCSLLKQWGIVFRKRQESKKLLSQ